MQRIMKQKYNSSLGGMQYSAPQIEIFSFDSTQLLCGSNNSSMYEEDMGNGGFSTLKFDED